MLIQNDDYDTDRSNGNDEENEPDADVDFKGWLLRPDGVLHKVPLLQPSEQNSWS